MFWYLKCLGNFDQMLTGKEADLWTEDRLNK